MFSARGFSLHNCTQSNSGAHPASRPTCPYQEVTRVVKEVDQSLPPSDMKICLRFPTRLYGALRNRRLRSLEARVSLETSPPAKFSNTCYLCDIWSVQHSRHHFLRRHFIYRSHIPSTIIPSGKYPAVLRCLSSATTNFYHSA